jgi:hypothetical protein
VYPTVLKMRWVMAIEKIKLGSWSALGGLAVFGFNYGG